MEKRAQVSNKVRRFGRFEIPTLVVMQYPDDVRRIMAECIIVRCEHSYMHDAFLYEAFCEQFDELGEGEIAPGYTWQFTDTDTPIATREAAQ